MGTSLTKLKKRRGSLETKEAKRKLGKDEDVRTQGTGEGRQVSMCIGKRDSQRKIRRRREKGRGSRVLRMESQIIYTHQ